MKSGHAGWTALITILGLLLVPAIHSLELSEYVEMALEESSTLRQQSMDLLGASEAVRANWSLLLPSIGLTFRSAYNQNSPEPISNTLSASLSLQLSAGVAGTMKMNRLELEQASLEWESARSALEKEVSDSFYRLILLREQEELLAGDLELALSQLDRSRVQFDRGLINERTLLQARLGVEQSRLALERHLATVRQEERGFRRLTGLNEAGKLVLDGTIDPEPLNADADKLIADYLAGRGDMRSAELQLRRLAASRSIRSWARAPSLSLAGGLSGLESSEQSLSASLSLSIPLDGWIPGSGDSQELRDAEREYEKAEMSLEEVRKNAELEIRNLVSALEQSGRSIDISTLQVEIAERLYRLSEEGFGRGTVERLELEEARGDLLSARLELLNDRYDYLSALLDLKQALNTDTLDHARSSR